jgi:phospholipase C
VPLLIGCAGNATIAPPARLASTGNAAAFGRSASVISHVIIIVQENRSVDDLFNGFPGADTVRWGRDSHGGRQRLTPIPLTAPYDISHRHDAFEAEFDRGRLDGFNLVHSNCRYRWKCPRKGRRSYGFVPHDESKPYFDLAKQYAFADRMFQTNQGPSFPAHQYLLSGTSTVSQGSSLRAAENPLTKAGKFTGGCSSPPGSLVLLIDERGREKQQKYPCLDRPSITDLLEARALTWRYYQSHPRAGLWNGPDAIRHIQESSDYRQHVVRPPSRVLSDIVRGRLANAVWVTPTSESSDHAGATDGSGPSWVASIVNAVGQSPYWNDTAILVTWDDWGGWYDHVAPTQFNSYELGFRIPLIVISPYAKTGYVSHVSHEFGSILKFVEETFGLGSLNTTDVRSDDLSDCFDFSQQPRRFKPIAAPLSTDYFLRHADSAQSPDTDN